MDKQKFIEGLRNPSNLKDNDLIALNQVVSEYPYFLGARVLLAKASKDNNDVKAKKYISSAAVYATDRLLLKKFLNDHLFFIDAKNEPEDGNPKRAGGSRISLDNLRSTEEKIEDRKRPKKAHSKERRNTSTKPGTRTLPKDKTSESNKPSIPDQKGPSQKVTPPTSKPAPVQEPSKTDIDKLIAEIYVDIEDLKVSRARFFELEDKIEEEDAVNAALEKAQATQEVSFTEVEELPAVEVSEINEEEKPGEEEKPEEAVKVENVEPPHIQTVEEPPPVLEESKEVKKPSRKKPAVKRTARVSTAKKESKPKKSPKAATIKKKGDSTKIAKETAKESNVEPQIEKKEVKEKLIIDETPEAEVKTKVEAVEALPDDTLKVVRRRSGKVQSTTYEKRNDSGDEKEKIIDEFISKRPSIKPAKKSVPTDKKEDLADSSTRFQADIASEYLAEIYVEQGKIQRAISIYDQLGLKFPEKKSFFASRIEELKSKKDK